MGDALTLAALQLDLNAKWRAAQDELFGPDPVLQVEEREASLVKNNNGTLKHLSISRAAAQNPNSNKGGTSPPVRGPVHFAAIEEARHRSSGHPGTGGGECKAGSGVAITILAHSRRRTCGKASTRFRRFV